MVKDQVYEGYCVRCRKKRKMKDTRIDIMKSGMKAVKGQCIKCDCNMCKIIGKA